MSDFPITEAQLVSIFAEAVFYGISVATFFESLRALVGSTSTIRASSLTRRVFMVITTLMFLVSSTDIALLLRHILNAFVYYRGAGGATEKFRQIDDPMNIARAITFPLQTFMGDGVLIYRTFIVYNRKWLVVVLPLVLLLADAFCGFAIAYKEATFSQDNALITADSITPWTTSFTVITLVENVICTSLIVGRIVVVNRQSKRNTNRQLKSPLERATRIILESGLLYTASTTILLGTALAGSPGIYPVSDSMVPITAICFNLIIVRANWYATEQDSTSSQALSHNAVPMQSVRLNPHKREASVVSPIEVMVSKRVDHDVESLGHKPANDLWDQQ